MDVKNERLYAAREIETGKLVSYITNPRRKYWDKKGNAEKAINAYNRRYEGVSEKETEHQLNSLNLLLLVKQ